MRYLEDYNQKNLMKLSFLITAILVSCSLMGQTIGDWRLHFSYENSIDLISTPNKIYSATNDAILVFDKDDNTSRSFDKANALSDIGVSAIGYASASNTVIVAYNSSNIDLIKGNTIVNMPDIVNDLSSGSKSINSIYSYQNLVYLNTDFGIVVLDPINEIILSTYIIGSTGNPVKVLDCAIFNDTIYAVTAEGLKSAPLSSTNLLDFSSWNHSIQNLPAINFDLIEVFENKLYVVADKQSLYQYQNGSWNLVYFDSDKEIISLKASNQLIFITLEGLDYTIYKTLGNSYESITTQGVLAPVNAIKDQNIYFFSDLALGLIRFSNNTPSYLRPSSNPYRSNSFRVSSLNNRVYVSGGGFSAGVDPLGFFEDGFYFLEKNKWTNVNKYNTPGYEIRIQDVTIVKENPITGLVYAGSMKGLMEYNFNSITVFDDLNSPIEPATDNTFFRMVTAVDFDRQGNTWFINALTNEGLKVKTKNGEWYSYNLGEGPQKYNNLFIDNNGNKWFSRRNEGVIVFREKDDLSNTTNFDFVKLTVNQNLGNLPNNIVNVVTQDKSGAIWIGTNKGVAVFDCPERIFDPSSPCRVSRRVKSTLDEYTEFLFDNDAVRAITIDGANRKWIGTESGVWLLSASGEDEILSFNTSNSPLPSNRINDIAINDETGEVFIATELGLASYFGDATKGAENHSNLKAFPNPVVPSYTGPISITGLVEGAFVKIVDTRGVLIHEGFAIGGKYVWNGQDFSGRKAATGMYFIFSSNEDGTEKASTKIAFVN